MIELTAEVPDQYLPVNHSLTRAIDKSTQAELIIEEAAPPELYRPVGH